MGLIYFGAVVPMGLIMQLKGRDALRMKKGPQTDSYWIRGSPPFRTKHYISSSRIIGFPDKEHPVSFLAEFWEFIRQRKKFWLVPLLALMLIFGGLIVLTKGSAVAPFIYAIF